MHRRAPSKLGWPIALLVVCAASAVCNAETPTADSAVVAASIHVAQFVSTHCVDCHSSESPAAELSLDSVRIADASDDIELWEKVVRKLRARQMPPLDMPRPEEAEYEAVLAAIVPVLDALAEKNPQPGRTETIRRLTRTEYRNAIRDLTTLDIDVEALLPPDESSHGFDNITVGNLSPTLLNRYINAAQKISQLAVGRAGQSVDEETIRIRADITQEQHVEGLPVGTRGGALIRHNFPRDGEYVIQVRLARDRNEEVEGLSEPHELEILLDREQVARFEIVPPKGGDHQAVDAHLTARVKTTGGEHALGVTFLRKSPSLLETKRQPYNAKINVHRSPRTAPAVYQVSIIGPYNAGGPGDTASRRRIFVCTPENAADEESCAERILSTFMRRAYRRPVDGDDLARPMELFRAAHADGGFDAGIEAALSAVLVSPHYLFRLEQQPEDVAPNTPYPISDIELASRLSFFLWSSIPDDELLDLADAGRLSEPSILGAQARRMLADDRASALATNFASQWLYLRNLESITPDLRLFPDFDHNLREAMRRETELFFASIVREDRSVLDLLQADYTYLNERLARHYGIPHVLGSRFRRVTLDAESKRGGLLRHGSILTVTSYATRTSPVLRGQWILKNLLGSPLPPPPPNVPALEDNTVAANLTVRERLSEHRKNQACAICHDVIDPIGFALENFDAVGRWRDVENDQPVDASGGLPDGSEFAGVDGLEEALLERPDVFVGALVEKLMTYGLGRGVDYNDAAAVRKIVRDAQTDDYRFSSLVEGIVTSTPFRMRMAL